MDFSKNIIYTKRNIKSNRSVRTFLFMPFHRTKQKMYIMIPTHFGQIMFVCNHVNHWKRFMIFLNKPNKKISVGLTEIPIFFVDIVSHSKLYYGFTYWSHLTIYIGGSSRAHANSGPWLTHGDLTLCVFFVVTSTGVE